MTGAATAKALGRGRAQVTIGATVLGEMSASLIGPVSQQGAVSVLWSLLWSRLGAGHASLRSRTQDPTAWRCTHWSDGGKSHAFGRALRGAADICGFIRTIVHTPTNPFATITSGLGCLSGSCCYLLSTPAERRAIAPHAMQDDGQLACHCDHRAAVTSHLGQPCAPGLQRRPLLVARQ